MKLKLLICKYTKTNLIHWIIMFNEDLYYNILLNQTDTNNKDFCDKLKSTKAN